MKLRSIKIKGWRSFDPNAGISLNNLGRINLIVGPNNVGKSNVVRFFKWLRQSLLATESIWSSAAKPDATAILSCDISEANRWLRSTNQIDATLAVSWDEEDDKPPREIFSRDDLIYFQISATHSAKNSDTLFMTPVMTDEQSMFSVLPEGKIGIWTPEGKYKQEKDLGDLAKVPIKIRQFFANQVIDVQALRHLSLGKDANTRHSSHGGETLEALLNMSLDQSKQYEWTKFRSDIKKWLRILLNEPSLSQVEILPNNVRLSFERSTELTCTLEDLGTGVAELLMLLVFLRLHPDDPRFVLIEEPEAHLHPAAALELIRIIRREMPQHQFLITTHSTSLVDGVEPDWRIFRASRQESGATIFTPLETSQDRLNLLNDLGLRPSQLFLANFIIWVEGPSDVIYLRRLLRDVDDKGLLLEGRSHSFVMYGGSSLSHMSLVDVADDEDIICEWLVRCLHVAPHNIIICDSDITQSDSTGTGERLKKRVVRLNDEAQALSNNYVFIVPAREIENCISIDILQQAIESSIDYVVIDKKHRKVTIELPTDTGERFHLAFAKKAHFDPDLDASIRDDAVKRLAVRIAHEKVAIANFIAIRETGSPFTDIGLEFGRKLLAKIAERVQ